MEQPYSETLIQCPLCGAGELAPLLTATDATASTETFIIQKCVPCGFAFTNPRPDKEHIGRYYKAETYISHSDSTRRLQDRLYQSVRRRTLEQKHKLIAKYHSSGSILDYGCGTGDFLAHMGKQGYSTTGVEPSPEARAHATKKHALVPAANLNAILPDTTFQVVTLWHVLEHIHDLEGTVSELTQKLAHGGLLVIAVPDRESWDAHHYAGDWAAWDVPRHLYHFRRADIRKLIGRHGLQLLRPMPMWFDAYYVSMLSEQHKGVPVFRSLIKGALYGLLSNLFAVCSQRPTSSTLYLAQKV